MAALTAATLSVPSFCGLRASAPSEIKQQQVCSSVSMAAVPRVISASASDHSAIISKLSSAALIATTAFSVMAASPAMAVKVEVGDEVGSFKFTPSTVTVAAGEPIEFQLVGETGHNVVFDLPSDAPAPVASELAASSMGENDLLSEDEPTFTAKISTPGTYSYYCTPHKSANMKGVVIVK